QHADGRVVHLRQRRHRQHPVGDHARKKDRHHQQGGGHRTQDEQPREVHCGFRAPFADSRFGDCLFNRSLLAAPSLLPSAAMTSTLLPSRRRSVPSSTRRSPGSTPSSIRVVPVLPGPTLTGRTCTLLLASTTYTK